MPPLREKPKLVIRKRLPGERQNIFAIPRGLVAPPPENRLPVPGSQERFRPADLESAEVASRQDEEAQRFQEYWRRKVINIGNRIEDPDVDGYLEAIRDIYYEVKVGPAGMRMEEPPHLSKVFEIIDDLRQTQWNLSGKLFSLEVDHAAAPKDGNAIIMELRRENTLRLQHLDISCTMASDGREERRSLGEETKSISNGHTILEEERPTPTKSAPSRQEAKPTHNQGDRVDILRWRCYFPVEKWFVYTRYVRYKEQAVRSSGYHERILDEFNRIFADQPAGGSTTLRPWRAMSGWYQMVRPLLKALELGKPMEDFWAQLDVVKPEEVDLNNPMMAETWSDEQWRAALKVRLRLKPESTD